MRLDNFLDYEHVKHTADVHVLDRNKLEIGQTVKFKFNCQFYRVADFHSVLKFTMMGSPVKKPPNFDS